MKNLKQNDDFSVSAIVNKQAFTPYSYGDLYIDIANKTSGSTHHIYGDFAEIMNQYGGTILEKIKKQKREPYYFLLPKNKKRSLSHQLKVLVNGVEVTEGTDYSYSESRDSIYFNDGSLPEEGDQIEIQYYYMSH